MEEKRPFGDYIRKKRLEAGLTQKELAGRLFVTESSVSKWERNLSCPDVSLVTSICRELRISEHEFFTACDDHQAHAQERAAARWRRAASILRWCCLAGYAAAIPVCFVCDWVLFHSLDWFWVVLAGIALSFCFTNLPFWSAGSGPPSVWGRRVPVCSSFCWPAGAMWADTGCWAAWPSQRRGWFCSGAGGPSGDSMESMSRPCAWP